VEVTILKTCNLFVLVTIVGKEWRLKNMIIIDCEQNTDTWFAEKIGKPSASNCSKILTNDGKPSKQREGYLYELCAERLTGQKSDNYQNGVMLAGQEREDASRAMFELTHNVEVKKVGVIYRDEKKQFLCSPDGIVTGQYGLELKNPLPKTQVKYLLKNRLPSEYFGQVQFSLYVTGFEKWMFMSYVPLMNPFIVEVKPDEKFITALKVELEVFCKELNELTTKIRRT